MKKSFIYALPVTLLGVSVSTGFAAPPVATNELGFISAAQPMLQLAANEMEGAEASAEENTFKAKEPGYFPGTDSELSAEEDLEISEPAADAEVDAEDLPFNSKEPGYFPGTDSELSAEE